MNEIDEGREKDDWQADRTKPKSEQNRCVVSDGKKDNNG